MGIYICIYMKYIYGLIKYSCSIQWCSFVPSPKNSKMNCVLCVWCSRVYFCVILTVPGIDFGSTMTWQDKAACFKQSNIVQNSCFGLIKLQQHLISVPRLSHVYLKISCKLYVSFLVEPLPWLIVRLGGMSKYTAKAEPHGTCDSHIHCPMQRYSSHFHTALSDYMV